jgi:predicted alpha/beta-hydrolase family hydrolase
VGRCYSSHVTEQPVDLGGHPGLLVKPRGANALYVLAHGAGAGMRHDFMAKLAAALAEHKIATLRWEFPYMAAGKARVDKPEVAERAVREVVTAAAKLVRTWRAPQGERGLPLFAGGKSFGGRMTSRAHAASPLPIRGLIFVGFPLHPAKQPATERADHMTNTMGPMLFVQGTRDDLAELTLLRPIVKRTNAQLHIIDGADHGFTRSGHVAEVAAAIRSWIDRVL